jgi:hypothetical protein
MIVQRARIDALVGRESFPAKQAFPASFVLRIADLEFLDQFELTTAAAVWAAHAGEKITMTSTGNP